MSCSCPGGEAHHEDTDAPSSNARPSLLLYAVEKEPEDEVQLAGDDRMERPARKKWTSA